MNCPHWRYGLRCMGMGYCVGLGCVLSVLPWEIRTFLVAWPLLVFVVDRGTQ